MEFLSERAQEISLFLKLLIVFVPLFELQFTFEPRRLVEPTLVLDNR